ncbi:MAG: hypothetical protein RBT65_02675 [Methanolobus sp.]|nr:hypothetical protein [Methanolobus sp.]
MISIKPELQHLYIKLQQRKMLGFPQVFSLFKRCEMYAGEVIKAGVDMISVVSAIVAEHDVKKQ